MRKMDRQVGWCWIYIIAGVPIMGFGAQRLVLLFNSYLLTSEGLDNHSRVGFRAQARLI